MIYDVPKDFISIFSVFQDRECQMLIEVIETCKLPKDSGLKVLEIPDDLEYHVPCISDESWFERIEEVHRVYTSQGCILVGKNI